MNVGSLAVVVALVLAAAVGCSPSIRSGATPNASRVEAGDKNHAVEGAPREELPWATFSPETFARAKAERKFVVMDGSAEWCHWCHVMEATTYHDATVRAVLDKHFIAVKVDVDSRPDLAERYGDYGWPATIIFSPDAMELGKYRGYLAPEKFTEILREVVSSGGGGAATTTEAGAEPGRSASYVVGAPRGVLPKAPLAEEQLAWIQRATDIELDEYWDSDEGGWGRMQKAPMGMNNAWLLEKASRGLVDADAAKKKVLFTLDQQAKLIDPVWGGIYQYSAAKDWDHPHFEKLMTFQAWALENYAVAYALTKDPKQLARARLMQAYLDRFMKGAEGGFFTTQDADVNAHDRTKPFMNGHDYYALTSDKDRLARGIPRVDTNEYGRENGLAITAYVAMYEATKDASALASAEKAAKRILATHATKRGGISHAMRKPEDTEEAKILYLADNAAFALSLIRLYEATKNNDWDKEAKQLSDFILNDLQDPESGALFSHTKDPDAVGIFAKRRIPFEDNVTTLRLLARVAKTSTDPKYKQAIDRILRAISTPEEIKARGRMLGDYLLALEETKSARSNH